MYSGQPVAALIWRRICRASGEASEKFVSGVRKAYSTFGPVVTIWPGRIFSRPRDPLA